MAKMTQNWKTGLTVAFTQKFTLSFSALALDVSEGLDTSGIANIAAAESRLITTQVNINHVSYTQ